MKKKFIIATALLCTLFTTNSLFAQSSAESSFQDVKGMNLLNAGIGLGSYGLTGTGALPLTASFEHGFSKNISAGINVGFIQTKYYDSWKYTYLIFGVRGSYHFNEALKINNPKLDVYGGVSIFYRHYKFNYPYMDDPETGMSGTASSSAGDVDFDLHAGARYMFGKKFGGYAELGYGISPLQLGVSLQF